MVFKCNWNEHSCTEWPLASFPSPEQMVVLPMIAAKVIVALDSVKMEGGLPRQDGRAERAGRARSVKGSTLYRKKDVLIVKSHAFPAKTKHTLGPLGYAFSLPSYLYILIQTITYKYKRKRVYHVCIRNVYTCKMHHTSGSGEGRSEKPSSVCTLPER